MMAWQPVKGCFPSFRRVFTGMGSKFSEEREKRTDAEVDLAEL